MNFGSSNFFIKSNQKYNYSSIIEKTIINYLSLNNQILFNNTIRKSFNDQIFNIDTQFN